MNYWRNQIRIFYSLKVFEFVFQKKKICIRRRANLLPSLLSSDLVRLISWEENSRKTNELHFQRRRGIDSSFNEGANIHLSFSLAEFDRIASNRTSLHLFYFIFIQYQRKNIIGRDVHCSKQISSGDNIGDFLCIQLMKCSSKFFVKILWVWFGLWGL